jgi:hypothetical protein
VKDFVQRKIGESCRWAMAVVVVVRMMGCTGGWVPVWR